MNDAHKKRSPSEIDAVVGERIRARRILLGLSQEALAGNLGVTFQQVQKYERAANRVSAGRLFEIANVLDVPIGHFFADKIEAVEAGTSKQTIRLAAMLEHQAQPVQDAIFQMVKAISKPKPAEGAAAIE